MTAVSTIYIALLDEKIDVWRPVLAEHIRENLYRILDQRYDRDTEHWQFEPGDIVLCETVELDGGHVLAATGRAAQVE